MSICPKSWTDLVFTDRRRVKRCSVSASVYVVDDDPLVRTVSAKLLGAAGYSVETANDGVEALARLLQHEGAVALRRRLPLRRLFPR